MHQNQEPPKKQSHQLKALLLKNIKLQARQPCTNVCQIFTPIICLLFTFIIRDIVIDKIPSNQDNVYNQFPLVPVKFNNYTLSDLFLKNYIKRNCSQWYLYQIDEGVDRQFIGQRNGRDNGTGLLGQIDDTYYKQCKYNFSKKSAPFEYLHAPVFKIPQQNINNEIFKITQYLNQQDRQDIKHYKDLIKMPDGGIHFHKASQDFLSMNLQVMDIRNLDYYRPDGISKISYISKKLNKTTSVLTIPQGLLSIQQLISTAFLKQVAGSIMQSGVMYMPPYQSAPVTADLLINAVAGVLFPISLSLLLPVFLYLIVLQKQQKLIQMMRMNGMKMKNYWFVNFFFDLVLGLLTNIVFYVFGVAFLGGAIFQGTGTAVLLVIMFGWILDQIALATFFQTFITSSRAANIIGYLLTIWTNLIGATLSLAIYQYPTKQSMFFTIYPTFAFDRLFYLMLTRCTDDNCYTSLSNLDSEAKNCVIVLYVAFFIFQITGMYLYEIIPQQYGVRQKITFPLDFIKRKLFSVNNHNNTKQEILQQIDQQNLDSNQKHQEIEQNNDQFARGQWEKIKSIRNSSEHALIIKKLRKVYQNGKEAVKGMDLVVDDKEVFGLLGPNGAGKTTLISMITGIFQPTLGDCEVAGYSIKEDIQQVHINIGVCPQFDILWPQLTVQQHLYFYARLRGIGSSKQQQSVQKAIQQVNLKKFRNFYSNQLSGGMKRRLSVGISMVGNPRIVFLDEPTTGLDPENRRNLWQVLNNCRKKRSLFLTTHLMQEADTLCNRIGIITNGVLRTVGSQLQLKKTYGRGYKLSLNIQANKQTTKQFKANPIVEMIKQQNLQIESIGRAESVLTEDYENQRNKTMEDYERQRLQKKQILDQKIQHIKQKIKNLFPTSVVQRQINGYICFRMEDIVVSKALRKLNSCEISDIRENWGLTNSSLQDVFLSVVNQFESMDQKKSLLSQKDIILSNTSSLKQRQSIQSEESMQ